MGAPRKPVPAGGQPTPAAIAAADSTPPASGTPAADAAQADSPPTTGNQAPGTTEQTDERQEDGEIVDAAVLVAFGDYLPDEIVSAPLAEIERLKLAGTVDPHADAVAFVRSLQA